VTAGEMHAAAIASEQGPRTSWGGLFPDRTTEPPGAKSRGLRHDIQHELATISLLASLIGTSDDIGESSRARATQLVRETRWLAELFQAFAEAQGDPVPHSWSPPAERLRVDVLAGEVIAALRLTHSTEVHFQPAEAWTTANRLALWRALRNVLENAFRAAGPQGQVRVRVGSDGGSAVVQIDDDGPGLGAGPAGLASLGLTIVRDVLEEHCGTLAVATSDLGGGSVRVLLPAAPAPDRGDGLIREDAHARTGL
jgi:signal transduction histidine kinase